MAEELTLGARAAEVGIISRSVRAAFVAAESCWASPFSESAWSEIPRITSQFWAAPEVEGCSWQNSPRSADSTAQDLARQVRELQAA